MKKYVVYTCILNGYDDLKDPLEVDEAFDYICFTDDRNLKSSVFRFIYLENVENYSMTNRKYKILPHIYLKDYEYSIYLDGSIQIKRKLKSFLEERLGNFNFSSRKHRRFDSIYQIINKLKRLGVDKYDVLEEQERFYKNSEFEDDNKLIEAGVLLRKNCESTNKCMDMWWDQVNKYSYRDQISFPYVSWKNKFNYDTFNNSVFDNYFKLFGHQKKRKSFNNNLKVLIDDIKKFRIILVTGPQRSGTRICSNILSQETDYKYYDERKFNTFNVDKFISLVKDKEKKVIHCPAMSHICHKFGEDVFVVFMNRYVKNIINSEKRIKWNAEHMEIKRYQNEFSTENDQFFKKKSCILKYEIWDKYQKNVIKHKCFLKYSDLEKHEMFLENKKRVNFTPNQIK